MRDANINTKRALRKKHLQIRRGMSAKEIEDKSKRICEHILRSDEYLSSKTVFGYMAINEEVDLTSLLKQALCDGKKVAIPKVMDNKQMEFRLIETLHEVKTGCFGVLEPVSETVVSFDDKAMMIVPGLAFDTQGYRVGYGGGYYDRYIHKLTGEVSSESSVALETLRPRILGAFYKWQQVNDCFHDEHDIPLQTIVTENNP